MINALSSTTPFHLAPVPGRKLAEPVKVTVTEGDTVNLSAAGPTSTVEPGKVGCFMEPILGVLVALCGEAALAFAKKLAQDTGRALADVAREMIDQFWHKDKETAPKAELAGLRVQGSARTPVTLAILD